MMRRRRAELAADPGEREAVSSVAGYVVWIRGPRGPELQKWRELPPELSGYWPKRVIGSPIPVARGVYAKSIGELMDLFPAPVMPE
jgi:hypothetical protein